MLQIGAAVLLQSRDSVVGDWGSYYKFSQPLLQNRAVITNWDEIITNWDRYYKLGQFLEIGGVTAVSKFVNKEKFLVFKTFKSENLQFKLCFL